MPLLAVNYHYVGMPNYKYKGVNGLTVNDFLLHIKFLKNNFKLIGLNDLIKLDLRRDNYCIITFDDGLLCHYEIIFKLMKKENFPAAFFVNTMPLDTGRAISTHKLHIVRSKISSKSIFRELKIFIKNKNLSLPEIKNSLIKKIYRYDNETDAKLKYIINYILLEESRMEFIDQLFQKLYHDESKFVQEWYINESQIKEMDDFSPCIGSHSHSHIPLTKLSDKETLYELNTSKYILENILGKEIQFFSYPLGNKKAVSLTGAKLVSQAGYNFAFTMEREQNCTYKNKLLLARIDCNDLPTIGKKSIFEIKKSKLY